MQGKYPGESNYAFTSNSPLLFKDVDGRDKIVTVTFNLRDGRRLQIKMIDKSYFEYSPGYRYGKTPQPYKSDREINITIDFSKSTSNGLPEINSTTNRINPKNVSYYEYSQVSDALNAVADFFGFDTENKKTEFGYRILGNSSNTDWNDGLPKQEKDLNL